MRSRILSVFTVVGTLVVAVTLLFSVPTSANAQVQQRAVFDFEWQGGALLAYNATYDDQYVVALWAENLSSHPPYQARVLTSYSHDAGMTWAPPKQLYSHVYGTWAHSSTSDFAQTVADAVMDEEGVVHLIMIFGIWRSDGTEDPWCEVLYGQVDPVNGLLLNQYMLAERAMDEDHPGYINVALALGRELPTASGRILHVLFGHDPDRFNDTGEMLYARSVDGGLSFTTPVDINWYSGLDNPPTCDMTADRNGNVYVAYGPDWYSGSEPAAIHFTSSQDDGVTWTVQTNEGGNGGSPELLCEDGGTVYCFCNTTGTIDYKSSSDFGATWSTPVGVVSRSYTGHFAGPRIQAGWAEPGVMHVTFSDRILPDNTSAFEAFYFKMATNGNLLIPKAQMSMSAVPQNQWDFTRSLVVLGPEDILVGCAQRFTWDWEQVAFGKPYTMRVSYRPTGAPEPVIEATALPSLVWPNPMTVEANVSLGLESAAFVRVDVIDVNGRVVRHVIAEERAPGHDSVVWNGMDAEGNLAPSGVYFLRVLVDDEIWQKKVVVRR